MIRDVATRMTALDFRAHALLTDRAQERPAFFLNVCDVIDGLHALDIKHGGLGYPLAARAVRPERRNRRRFERTAGDGTQTAQGCFAHCTTGVLARPTQPADGIVRYVWNTVARLMHRHRARLARDELVKVEVTLVVAHRTPIDAPTHVHDFVIQRSIFIILVMLTPTSVEITAVQETSYGHLCRLNHSQRRLPLFRLPHASVLFELSRRHVLVRSGAIRALTHHLIQARVIVCHHAVTNHRKCLWQLVPVAQLGNITRLGAPRRLARIVVSFRLHPRRVHVRIQDFIVTLSLLVVELAALKHLRDHLSKSLRLISGELLVSLALCRVNFAPRRALLAVDRGEIYIVFAFFVFVLLEEIRGEELPRTLRTFGHGVLLLRHCVRRFHHPRSNRG